MSQETKLCRVLVMCTKYLMIEEEKLKKKALQLSEKAGMIWQRDLMWHIVM